MSNIFFWIELNYIDYVRIILYIDEWFFYIYINKELIYLDWIFGKIYLYIYFIKIKK